MRIILACDGYGAPLAEAVGQHLRATRPDIALEDRGTSSKYYEAAHQVAGEVEAAAAAGQTDVRAVLCCGSGQGMAIIANKYPHIFAALCTTPEAAAGSRSVNNSNILCMGAGVTGPEDGRKIVDTWLATELGDGWDAPVREFIVNSMPEIAALGFTMQATAGQAVPAAQPPQQQQQQQEQP